MDENKAEILKPAAAKLTNWANEPTLVNLKSDWTNAKSAHDAHIAKFDRWDALLHVTGKEQPQSLPGRSKVQPRLIRKVAEWRYPTLTEPFLSSHSLFTVEPSTFADVEAARKNKLILDKQWRVDIDRVAVVDDLVRGIVDEGTVVVQISWDFESKKVKKQVPVWEYLEVLDPEQINVLSAAVDEIAANPAAKMQMDEVLRKSVEMTIELGQPVQARQNGTELVEVEEVIHNRPAVEIHDPRNVVIDPSCKGDLNKAMFVIVSFETNKAALLKYPDRYKNLDAISWASAHLNSDGSHATSTPSEFNLHDSTRAKKIAYEYWGFYDIEGNGTLTPIVATWIGDVLIRMEKNPYPDQKLPFVLTQYMRKKRSLYGEPDAELLADNQRISGALSRGMIDLLARSSNGQRGFAKGMLDVVNRRRLDNGQDYEYNPSTSPAMALIEHKYPELPQSAFALLNLQNNEADSSSGVKSFSDGISGASYGDVAAGVRGALTASSQREMSILRRVARALKQIGEKIVSMNSAFLSQEEEVAITSGEFATIARDELSGLFRLEVDISTAEVDNAKANDLAFMVQTLGQKIDQKVLFNLLAEIARLKRMVELEHYLRNWQPPEPSPEQQAMAQEELRKLKVENDKTEAETRKILAEAQLAEVQAYRTASGEDHREAMEQGEAQARGNQDAAVTKALLTSQKPGESPPDVEAAVGFNAISKMN